MDQVTDEQPEAPPAKKRSWLRRVVLGGFLLFGVLFGLLAVNGLTSDWETLEGGETASPAHSEPVSEVRVVAYNLAKLSFERSVAFRSTDDVRSHLDEIAVLLLQLDPDVVALSEVLIECTPCEVNQVQYLAEAMGMHAWVFGENVNYGLPFFRFRTGNAVLSRFPLRPLSNMPLAGKKPFFWPANTRRLLWTEVQINERWVRVGSVHNDSFNPENNAKQVDEILEELGAEPAILAGDFNAKPRQSQIGKLRDSGKFAGVFTGEPTAPAAAPQVRIDYVFAPAAWEHVETVVVASELSDHRPVLGVFKVE